MDFYRKENLLDNFVLVDGIARCGKSLVSPILSSLERVEIERVEGIFDFVSVSHYFGGMSEECAINLLRSVADGFIYDSYLSRNANFRWSDPLVLLKGLNKFWFLNQCFQKKGLKKLKGLFEKNPFFKVRATIKYDLSYCCLKHGQTPFE